MRDLKEKSPSLLVIGDLIVDQYLWGSCERISPEAPVQVININNENLVLGGAGNVVNNLKKLGASVDIVSVIGICETSKELRRLLSNINVDTKYLITQKDRASSKKSRIIASQQQVVRFDRESSEDISLKSQNSLIETARKIFKNYDAILFSDYGKGIFTSKLTQALINVAKLNNKKVLVDPKGVNYIKYRGAYALTPNRKEASEATRIEIADNSSLKNAAKKLKSLCSLTKSLITLSENGIAVYDKKFRIHSTNVKEVFDVTGAGDTVLASLGYALATGLNIDDSIKFSNLAAGVVVGKIGSATCTMDEIAAYNSRQKKSTSNKHINSFEEMNSLVKELKLNKKRIIFTNGCFDLLHAGHISYLEAAKDFGDILIIGLNSDKSVTNIKGIDRPINSEIDRAKILASIEVVDYVIIFEQDTPYELIKVIKPDILVKGADYKPEEVVGNDLVNELKLIPLLKGKSSTNTIKKIINKKIKI